MRDAIVLSGWTWEANNVPERMARALAHAGSRVLYCENPSSLFWGSASEPVTAVSDGIFVLGLRFLGHRFNRNLFLRWIQARLLVNQITLNAADLALKNPLIIYPHGEFIVPLIKEFKRKGFRLIHICMDYELHLMQEHARLSDLTLAIPHAAYEELKQQFGEKVKLIPQFAMAENSKFDGDAAISESANNISRIKRPRLGYLGRLGGRISSTLLTQVLRKHPGWQFICFGGDDDRALLPNEHVLSWGSQKELQTVLDGLDVGFMPYDCSIPKNLHCVPLKLFDYFSRGLPVVSTSIVYLRNFANLVYLGDTADELDQAIRLALEEPADSPKRSKRMAIARNHSIEKLAQILAPLLYD
jgi:hypothetical protein